MKRFEAKERHPNPSVKQAHLDKPDGLKGKRLTAWNKLLTSLGYLEAKL